MTPHQEDSTMRIGSGVRNAPPDQSEVSLPIGGTGDITCSWCSWRNSSANGRRTCANCGGYLRETNEAGRTADQLAVLNAIATRPTSTSTSRAEASTLALAACVLTIVGAAIAVAWPGL
jgi:hypothetical protein